MASSRLISRLQLSKRVAIGKSQVYRDCAKGGKLECALVGGEVDLEHQAARMYCAEHNYKEPDVVAISKGAPKPQQPANATLPPDEFADNPDNAEAYLDMPLREIVARYGTQPQFKNLVGSAKNLLAMRGMEEEQARKRGEYIHRAHVEKLVALVDSLQKALLSDAVSNMATTTEAQVKAGATRPEVEKSMRNTISRVIKITKSQIVRALRDG